MCIFDVRRLRVWLVLALLLIFGGCSTLSPPPPERPKIPPPLAELMLSESEFSAGYSQKARAWLQKAKTALDALMPGSAALKPTLEP